MTRVVRQILCGTALCAAVAAHGATSLWGIQDTFVDETGKRASLSHWAGAQTVVSMEYSACKFVCSTNWKRLLDIQAEADRQSLPVRFLIVSIDPMNDTPAAWRDYRQARGMTRTNWAFVTGNRSATDKVVSALGVKWWYFNEAIMHDFRILRLNSVGEQVAVMQSFDESAATFLTAKR